MVFGALIGFGNYGGPCGNFWLYGNFLFYFLDWIIAVAFLKGCTGAGWAVWVFLFAVMLLCLVLCQI